MHRRPPALASSGDPRLIFFFSSSSSFSFSTWNTQTPFYPRSRAFRTRIMSRHRPWPLRCSAGRSSDVATPPAVEAEAADGIEEASSQEGELRIGVGSPSLPANVGMCRMSVGDQAFFLLAFIACTTSVAFTSLVFAAVPTLCAMKRAAISLAKLADVAREELPSTMAAIRLSGMEISDLTLELSDLSQEIADGVTKSAQAMQAAEAGIRHIGSMAQRKTISMIEERANLPNISLRPMVAGAARKTSQFVRQAKKTFMNMISGGGSNPEPESSKVEC